ncbi:MAG: hypothetical protein OJF49_001345 [Ktedonobacterales bacterium]|jgi:hypothetical protein|nr:MAG: hypothetical protein OJF49_001345 [Ktedonobacterales bacterium]
MERQNRVRSVLSRLPSLLVVAALVAGLFATITALQRRAASPQATTFLGDTLTISTAERGHILCPTQAAFSPDGAQVAVWGATQSCRAANAAPALVPHTLAFYVTRSGALLNTIALDPLIGVDDTQRGPAQPVRAVRYFGLGWSPDGAHLAFAFATFDDSHHITQDDLLDSGLLLVDTHTASATVIHGDAGFFSAPTSSYMGFPVWNLTHPSVTPAFTPSPALAYAWGADGLPEAILPLGAAPLSHLPINAGPRYPVGVPAGDSTYTTWQPGILFGPDARPGMTGAGPSTGALVSVFPAWSPDGAHLTLMVTGNALALPDSVARAGSNATPGGAGSLDFPFPASLTQVPARDAALTAAQREIGRAGWALVAWNPGGTLLASVACSDQNETLTLRQTESGQTATQTPLTLGRDDHGCAGAFSGENAGDYPSMNQWLRWSSDGNSLLLTDATAATVTLWNLRSAPPAS